MGPSYPPIAKPSGSLFRTALTRFQNEVGIPRKRNGLDRGPPPKGRRAGGGQVGRRKRVGGVVFPLSLLTAAAPATGPPSSSSYVTIRAAASLLASACSTPSRQEKEQNSPPPSISPSASLLCLLSLLGQLEARSRLARFARDRHGVSPTRASLALCMSPQSRPPKET